MVPTWCLSQKPGALMSCGTENGCTASLLTGSRWRGHVTEWWAKSQETKRLISALPLMKWGTCYKTDIFHTLPVAWGFSGKDSLVFTLEFPLVLRVVLMSFLPTISYHCMLQLAMPGRTLCRLVSAAEKEQRETCAEKGSTKKTEQGPQLLWPHLWGHCPEKSVFFPGFVLNQPGVTYIMVTKFVLPPHFLLS